MKVVINRCYGGFCISEACAKWMAERGHKQSQEALKECEHNRGGFWHGFYMDSKSERTDPMLVQAIETLGEKASGSGAELAVVEIPDDVQFEIDSYDGLESVEELHRSWR